MVSSTNGLAGRVKRLEEKILGHAPDYRCEACHDTPILEFAFESARERYPQRPPCPECGSPRLKIKQQPPREDGE